MSVLKAKPYKCVGTIILPLNIFSPSNLLLLLSRLSVDTQTIASCYPMSENKMCFPFVQQCNFKWKSSACNVILTLNLHAIWCHLLKNCQLSDFCFFIYNNTSPQIAVSSLEAFCALTNLDVEVCSKCYRLQADMQDPETLIEIRAQTTKYKLIFYCNTDKNCNTMR